MRLHLLKAFMFGLLCLGVAACSNSPDRSNETDKPPVKVTEIGNFLFVEAPWPKYPVDSSADPIRVPLCHLTVFDRVDVPSREDGTIAWLGAEATAAKVDPMDLFINPHNEKSYRRLRLGDLVVKGQVIAQLNDDRAVLEVDIAVATSRAPRRSSTPPPMPFNTTRQTSTLKKRPPVPRQRLSARRRVWPRRFRKKRVRSGTCSEPWAKRKSPGQAEKPLHQGADQR